MTKQIRFTKQAIEALPPAARGARDYYQDARLPSLRIAVTATGAKSWVVQRRIRGRVTRITLGRFPDVTPENARKLAEQTAGQIAMGSDPQSEKRDARARRLTLGDALEEFLKVRRLKPTTVRLYRQLVTVGLGDWLRRPFAEISKDNIAERHAKLTRDNGGPYANSAMRTFRSLWNFTAGQYENSAGDSLLPSNPVERLSKTKAWNRVRPKQTYVKEHELPAWFSAVGTLRAEPRDTSAKTVGDYLMVLILTGMRRNEAASLTWDQISLPARMLVLKDTKNRQDHSLPLSDYLHELLTERFQHRGDSAHVFPGDGRSGYLQEPRHHVLRVIEASGITFTLHDLRRTFITAAERLDLPAYVLSRLANHKLGHSVTRDYIVTDIERLRAPMQKITDYFLSAGGIRRSVVAMQGGRK